MKIALLAPAMEMGGVEQGTFDLACGFAARGHRVLVISGPGRLIPPLQERGVAWYPAPMERKDPFNFGRAVRRVRRILSAEQPDIIHSRSRLPAWAARFSAGADRRGHQVTSIHGFYHNRRYSRILARGERVIVISEGLKEYAVRSLGADRERVRVVYNGFDFSPYLNLKPARPAVQGKFTVGAVGRLTVVQGFRYLLEAVALLEKDFPELKVILVGGGPEEDRLRNLAGRLGLRSRVSFVKGRAFEYLASLDLMVVPSVQAEPRPENGPFWSRRTGAEAQVAGVPVVATMSGVPAGSFEIGQAGVYTAPRDPAGLSKAITYLVTHPLEGRELAGRAMETAVREFSLEKMVERTLAVYRELVGRSD